MSAPLGLDIKSNTSEMTVGNCIPCRYTALTSGVPGYFYELGTCTADEIPVTGTATPDGKFYFNMVEPTLLIADRVIQTNISWDTLNNIKYIEGALLYNNLIPIMTSNTSPLGEVKVSGVYNNDLTYNGWKAFDKSFVTTSRWASSSGSSAWIYYKFLNPKKISQYIIYGDAYSSTQSPKSWTIEGSNNGSDWQILDTQINQTNWGLIEKRKFSFINNNYYLYYKINVSANNGGAAVCITEIEMIENSLPYLIRSISGGCAYVDENGNISLTDKGLGAWPVNNEWDKYIVNSDLGGKITSGDDNVWHWNSGVGSWCKETPVNGLVTPQSSSNVNTARIVRSKYVYGSTFGNSTLSLQTVNSTSAVVSGIGFRPVLQLKHSKQQNLWY